MEKGDYVLATKWEDGDPHDQWCVGFFDSMLKYPLKDRYHIVDENGKPFRRNGFRRAEKISETRGRFILENMERIQRVNRSLWFWKRTSMKKHNTPNQRTEA